MNVRLTPIGQPGRTDVYFGVRRFVLANGRIELHYHADVQTFNSSDYEKFSIDNDGAVT